MPILPLRRRWSSNLRNHRKFAVTDGARAWLGGMNLAKEYLGPQPSPDRWIDTAVAVEGPAAADLDRVFAADWAFATRQTLAPAPDPSPADGTGPWAQVVASGPDVPGDSYAKAILVAVLAARRRVWVVTPYFVPDEPLLKALDAQARMGRDVRVVVPERSNHRLADLARARFLRTLARAGAQVLLVPEHMVHAKLLLFDDDLAVLGSANLDMRSLYLNFEISLFANGPGPVAAVAAWIETLAARAKAANPAPPGTARQWAEDLSLLVSPLI